MGIAYEIVHDGYGYRIVCQRDGCEFDKVSSTEWGADVASRSHEFTNMGHQCSIATVK